MGPGVCLYEPSFYLDKLLTISQHLYHFRPLPTMESGYFDDKNVLLEAIKSLSDLIMQTAEATKVINQTL